MHFFKEGDVIAFNKNDKVVVTYPGFQFKDNYYVRVMKVNEIETEMVGSGFFMRVIYGEEDIEMEEVTESALGIVLERYVHRVKDK